MATMEEFLKSYFQLNEDDQRNAFKELILYMTEEEVRRLFSELSNLQPLYRKSYSKFLSTPEKEFRKVVNHLATIKRNFQPEEVSDSLNRVSLFTKSAKEEYDYVPGTNRFRIALSKYQMVHVDFSGLGSEHLGEHPAIVWDVEVNRDHVVVIPCTSYKPDTTVESEKNIEIGYARFFDSGGNEESQVNVKTVALLDQIQPVSRKRIVRHMTLNPSINRRGIAKFGEDQVKRIKEGIECLFLERKTFFEKELLDILGVLPEFENHDEQYLHMFRSNYNRISDDNGILLYEIDGKQYKMIKRQTSLVNKRRRELLKNGIIQEQ